MLTLTEIAKIYRCSNKTFARRTAKYGYPHQRSGRDYLYDLAEVRAHIVSMTIPKKNNVVRFSVKRRKPVKTKFAEAVGI